MDIWYLPTITEYLKLMVKPIIYKITPEEAKHLLEVFDVETRKIFVTKGILNLFPKLKRLVLPSNLHLGCGNTHNYRGQGDLNNIAEDCFEYTSQSTKEEDVHSVRYFEHEDVTTINNNNDVASSLIVSPRMKISAPINFRSSKDVILKSSLSQNLMNNAIFNNNNKVQTIDNNNNNSQTLAKKTLIDNIKNKHINVYKYIDENGAKKHYRTIVIQDSKSLIEKYGNSSNRSNSNEDNTPLLFNNELNLNNLPRFLDEDLHKEFYWDNINEYYNRKNQESQKNTQSSIQPKLTFSKLLSTTIKEHLFNKIDTNKMSKAFLFFCIVLISQIIISKKVRNWSFSLIHFIIFLSTSLGASGSLYFLLNYKKKSKKAVLDK